jgi:hypothetical protein
MTIPPNLEQNDYRNATRQRWLSDILHEIPVHDRFKTKFKTLTRREHFSVHEQLLLNVTKSAHKKTK